MKTTGLLFAPSEREQSRGRIAVFHLVGQMSKKCFKCGVVKSLDEFYVHSMMADGHLNKCKECNKKDSTNHRNANIEDYREYDRTRGSRQTLEYQTEWRKKHPDKCKAYAKVSWALKSGKLQQQSCEICGNEQSVAHHDDYSKPLEVRWLCQAHHCQWHAKNGPGLNG